MGVIACKPLFTVEFKIITKRNSKIRQKKFWKQFNVLEDWVVCKNIGNGSRKLQSYQLNLIPENKGI